MDSPSRYWQRGHRGTYYPYVQNTMPKHVFEGCKRFIHLVDNKISRPSKGSTQYDPLFKFRKLMEVVKSQINKNWMAEERGYVLMKA